MMKKYLCFTLCVTLCFGQRMCGMSFATYKDGNPIPDIFGAAVTGDLDMVTGFIESGILVDSRNRYGFTPLHAASTRGCCNQLANANGPPVPLVGNHAAVVKFLIAKGALVDARSAWWGGCTPLYWAAQFGDAKILSYLLRAGADIACCYREDRSSVLHQAARSWDLEKVRLLVGAGANLAAQMRNDSTAADVAQSTIIRRYLTHKAQPTQKLFRVLHKNIPNNLKKEEKEALLLCDEKEAIELLKKGADPLAQDRNGDTPAHIAMRKRMVVLLRMLTAQFAVDISCKNYDKERPFLMNIPLWTDSVFFTGKSKEETEKTE